MSEHKIKHLATLIAWVLIHIYILAFRFTLYSLAVLVVAAVYLLVTTVFSKKHEDGYLSETIGNLLGTSLFVFLSWSVVTEILPEILANAAANDEFWLIKLDEALNNAVLIASQDPMSKALLGTVVVFVIQCVVSKSNMLKMLMSYVYNVLWMGAVLDVVYASKELSFMCVVIAGVFAFVEAWSIKAWDTRAKNGKRWLNVLTVLLFIVICWDPGFLIPYAQEGYLEYFFVISAAKWYHLLFAVVILGALAFVHGMYAFDEEDHMHMIDFRFPLRAACMFVLVFFLDKFHVGYWWVLMIIAIGYEIIDVLFIDSADRMYGSLIGEIAVIVLLIVLTIAGHFGRFVMTLAVLAGIIAIFTAVVNGVYDNDGDEWKPAAWMYTAIIAVIAVIAAISLWFYRNLDYNFWLLLALGIVSIGVLWLLSYNGSIKRSAWNIPQAVVMAVFVIGVGCLCFSHGSTIRFVEGERQTTLVEAEAKGEDNRIVSLDYYWTEDWLSRDNATFEIAEEVEISGNQIPNTEGKLRVVATDAYGITTEEIFWVHVAPDYSEAS